MIRALAVVSTLLLVIACQKQEKPSVEAPPAQTTPDPIAPEEGIEQSATNELKVTPALVKSYVAYRGDVLSAVTNELVRFNKLSAEVNKDSAADQLALANEAAKMQERIDAHTQRFLETTGLSATQFKLLEGLVDEMSTSALLSEKTEFRSTLAEMREATKDVPPEGRAEVDAELARMEAGFKKFAEHTDTRAQWGDAAVDTILEHIDEFKELQAQALELFAQMNK